MTSACSSRSSNSTARSLSRASASPIPPSSQDPGACASSLVGGGVTARMRRVGARLVRDWSAIGARFGASASRWLCAFAWLYVCLGNSARFRAVHGWCAGHETIQRQETQAALSLRTEVSDDLHEIRSGEAGDYRGHCSPVGVCVLGEFCDRSAPVAGSPVTEKRERDQHPAVEVAEHVFSCEVKDREPVEVRFGWLAQLRAAVVAADLAFDRCSLILRCDRVSPFADSRGLPREASPITRRSKEDDEAQQSARVATCRTA